MPRVGRVKAESLTAGQLQKVIEEKSRTESGKRLDVRVKRLGNAGADSASQPARRAEQPPEAPAPAGTPAPAEPAPGTNAQPTKSE